MAADDDAAEREVAASGAALRQRLAALPDPMALLQEVVANAPVGIQIFAPDGRCVLVNAAHTALFGAVPPPDFNVLEDELLVQRGVADLVRRGFAGERVRVPPIWYDPREVPRFAPKDGRGRRLAAGAQIVPLRGRTGEVEYVLFVFNDLTSEMEAREQAEAAAKLAEEARAAAEASAARSAFLAEAGRVLGASLDYETTLLQVARLATPTLGDFCIVDVLLDDGTIRRVAAVHADPEGQPALDELCRRYPPEWHSPQPAARVIRTGRHELLEEVDPRVVAEHTRDAAHKALIERIGIRSHLAVPLQIGGRTVGAISLATVGSRRYTAADVPLAEALASRAAVAIENARLYRLAEAARAEAEAANRAKDEFLAMLGHELRNPLAPIVTALELARTREPPSREHEIIERQVMHLRRLIDDLLDVARVTHGKLELDVRPLEIADAVSDGLELARPLLEQRGQRVELAVPGVGLPVLGDRVRLAQVVANLLTNAARYSDPGRRVFVRAERVGTEVVLRVRDEGIGMPADLVPRVFETFVQGARSVDRAAGGLGVGLAIVRALTELHGGRVAARSEGIGRGSEFEIVLPLADEPPSADADDGAPPQRALRTGKVLVVDDNVDAAEMIGAALAAAGFDVRVTHDPFDALALAKAAPPDVALLDLGLPGMDGYELARRLRDEPALARVRLVAVTGYGREADRQRCLAAGFAEHLVKPVKLATIRAVIERLLA